MKRTIQVLSAFTAVLLGSTSVLAQGTSTGQAIREEERAALFPTARMIEQGRAIVGTECANCHGMDGMRTGEGQPYLAGQRTIYLFRILQAYQEGDRENESMQHVSSFLNDEALISISAYYASLTPTRKVDSADVTEETGLLTDNPFAAIREAINKCAKCHGETGNSTASGMPSLTAQDPEYFVISMQAYIDGNRNHKLMSKLASKLDEETIREMGVFYAVQQPLPSETTGDGNAAAGASAAENCAICHGADGNTNTSDTPTLAGQDARYFIKAMQAYREGKRDHDSMFEAVERLSDNEIADLAGFYATQEPVRRDVRIPFTSAEWIERCERCHGINGNSTDPRFPMLAGQNKDYLRKAMRAYSAGERSTTTMHAMSAPLSDSDIERIVSYYAAQDPKAVIYMQLPCE